MPIEAIYLPLNTVFLTLQSSMVICTLYVHKTIANFLHYFGTKNHWYSDKIVQIILEKTSSAN